MKTLSTMLVFMALLCTGYAQGIEPSTEEITFAADSMTTGGGNTPVTLLGNVTITVVGKLNIECESAVYDRSKKFLTTYGTRKFQFSGTVTMGPGNLRIGKYIVGEDILVIE
jgi:hypothetical protein